MWRQIVHRIAPVLGLVLLLQTGGCASLLGLGAGAIVDQSRPSAAIPRSDWASLSPGTEVDVVLTDGFRVRGRTVSLVDAGTESAAWRIRTRSGDESIPVSEIRKLTRPGAHRGALVGLSIGLVVDVALVIIAAVAVSQESYYMSAARESPAPE
jgi:hypothetical protein